VASFTLDDDNPCNPSYAPQGQTIVAQGNALGITIPTISKPCKGGLTPNAIDLMPQSLANIYVHLIFSTKDRFPFLKDDVRDELHAYMATVLANLKCPAVLINSVEDHVHILFNMSRTVALATAVEEVKKTSSKWIKTKSAMLAKFSWQAGYGGFSVSESNVGKVANYIQGQEEHHRVKSFQEEYREFLEKHKIEYYEKYVWD